MAARERKRVLFLDGGTLDHARTAEVTFATMAKRMGFDWATAIADTASVALNELNTATVVVFVNGATGEATLRGRFPEFAGRVVSWSLPDRADKSLVEKAVSDLLAHLLGGRPGADVPEPPPPPPAAPKKLGTVKLSKETAGRRGKGVTVVSELALDEQKLNELATLLKNKCGTGGTAKDGRIEIQGDQRDRLQVELEKLGYKVKRSGG